MVEARRHHLLDRGGDLDVVDVAGEQGASPVPLDRALVHELAGDLFEEERVSLGALDDALLQGVGELAAGDGAHDVS